MPISLSVSWWGGWRREGRAVLGQISVVKQETKPEVFRGSTRHPERPGSTVWLWDKRQEGLRGWEWEPVIEVPMAGRESSQPSL